METIQWDDKMLLGFEMIDNQHREIYKLFDRISQRIDSGEYESVVKEFVEFLDVYIQYHFSQEEELQEFIEYPFHEIHKKEHEAFKERVAQYKAGIEEDIDIAKAQEGLRMLVEWLKNHIEKTDYQLVKFINDENL
jgi:hemerythrin